MDWPFLVALGALLVLLATYGLRARPTSPVNRWFALQTLCLAGWVTGIGGTHSAHLPELWGRWTFAWASLMPAAFLGFTKVFPEPSRWPSTRTVDSICAFALVLAAVSATTPWIAHDFVITAAGLKRQTGVLFPIFSLYFVVTATTVLGLLIVKWRRARGQPRAQLLYYVTGLLTLAIGGTTTNLVLPSITGHSAYSTVGPFFVLPLVALIGHAIIRHRLLDLRLIIGRGVSFALAIAACAVLLIATLNAFGVPPVTYLPLPLGVVAIFAITAILVSAPVAPVVSAAVDHYLLRGRPDLDRVVKETSVGLSRLLTVDEIVARLEAVIIETLAPEFVKIVRPSVLPETDQHLAAAVWAIEATPPAVQLVRFGITPRASSEVLRRAGVEVIVVLGRAGQRTAIVLIGPKRNADAYLAPAIRFLEELAEVASLALEVANLHARHIELERERQRLANLARMGRLYAGLGHEIRTPLTTISNLVSILPDRLDDPEFRDVLIRLIPAEVKRIVELAERLRALAPDARLIRESFHIAKVVEDVAAILGPVLQNAGIDLCVQITPPLQPLIGNPNRVTQLLQNLIVNAKDAMQKGGTILVEVSSGPHNLTLRVTDEGDGIPQEIEESLFEAFVTTKASGLGLGLSICQEVAREHDARLSLKNRPDRSGAVAEVVFALPAQPKSDLLVVDNNSA